MLRIRELRQARKLTQEALARRADMPVSTVQRIETRGSGTTENLRKIAHGLDVGVGELFEGTR